MEKEIIANFIESYKINTCLWDGRSVDYSNRQKRQMAYEKLSEILRAVDPKATVETAKKKIEILRNSYRRERNKVNDSQKTGSSPDDVYTPSLWYYTLLDDFLSKNECANKSGIDNMDDSQVVLSENRNAAQKRTGSNELINLAKKFLVSKNDDEFTNFGNNVASQLSRVNEQQNILAQKLISDVIFHARTNNLSLHTKLYNFNSDAVASTSSYISPQSEYQSPSPNLTYTRISSSPHSTPTTSYYASPYKKENHFCRKES